MPWITPKTDWAPVDGVADSDMNRIEGNIGYLKDNKVDVVSGKALSTNDYTDADKDKLTNLSKSDVGLGNVDNTSDANKPVSTAQQTALNGKANTSGTYASLRAQATTKSDVGLGNVSNDAQLKIASNLSDLSNDSTARSNLGLTGSSNTTHYHDSRYARSRVSGGQFQYLDGGEWKSVGDFVGKTIQTLNFFNSLIQVPTESRVEVASIMSSGMITDFQAFIAGSTTADIEIEVDGALKELSSIDSTFYKRPRIGGGNIYSESVVPNITHLTSPISFEISFKVYLRNLSPSSNISQDLALAIVYNT